MNSTSPPRKPLRERLTALMNVYGSVAMWIYVGLALSWFVGCVVALRLGFSPDGWVAGAGTLAAAYGLYKITMPARIMVALVIVPVGAVLVRRLQGRSAPVAIDERSDSPDECQG